MSCPRCGGTPRPRPRPTTPPPAPARPGTNGPSYPSNSSDHIRNTIIGTRYGGPGSIYPSR